MFKKLLATLALLAAGAATAAAPTLTPVETLGGFVVDSAPVGTRVPLVLVHGLGGSGDGWNNFLHAYRNTPAWRAAFKPYVFRYGSSADEIAADRSAPRTITALGGALRDALQDFHDRPATAPHHGFGRRGVVILAHSMGGLVARSMMQEHVFRDGRRGGERVLQLVTLGTPHHGTPMADAAFSLGLQYVPEFTTAYSALVRQMAWTNHDGLDMSSGVCNEWLARLNNFAPLTGGWYGRCGFVPGNPLPGFYEKIVAYAGRTLQQPEVSFGRPGIYRPGSSPAMLAPYGYLYGGLSRSYANDGVVPFASAQFHGAPVAARAQAYDCDHRFIERAYEQTVRSWSSSYREWAFCGASLDARATGGTPGGWSTANTIFGAAGGIVDGIRAVAQAERVLDWAEQVYANHLQPAGATTGIAWGYRFRHYAATQAYLGVKDGALHYLGPASSNTIVRIGTLDDLMPLVEAAGY